MVIWDTLTDAALVVLCAGWNFILLCGLAIFAGLASAFINGMAWVITSLMLTVRTPYRQEHPANTARDCLWKERYEIPCLCIAPIISAAVIVTMAIMVKVQGLPEHYAGVAFALSFSIPIILLVHFAYKAVQIRKRLPIASLANI